MESVKPAAAESDAASDLDEFQDAIRRATSGVRDPEAMRRAADRMDRAREEIRRQHGVLDIGVPAIRELRGELPGA